MRILLCEAISFLPPTKWSEDDFWTDWLHSRNNTKRICTGIYEKSGKTTTRHCVGLIGFLLHLGRYPINFGAKQRIFPTDWDRFVHRSDSTFEVVGRFYYNGIGCKRVIFVSLNQSSAIYLMSVIRSIFSVCYLDKLICNYVVWECLNKGLTRCGSWLEQSATWNGSELIHGKRSRRCYSLYNSWCIPAIICRPSFNQLLDLFYKH